MGMKQTEMPSHPTYPSEGGDQPKLSNPHLPFRLPPGLSDQDTKGTKNTSLLQKQVTSADEETADSGGAIRFSEQEEVWDAHRPGQDPHQPSRRAESPGATLLEPTLETPPSRGGLGPPGRPHPRQPDDHQPPAPLSPGKHPANLHGLSARTPPAHRPALLFRLRLLVRGVQPTPSTRPSPRRTSHYPPSL